MRNKTYFLIFLIGCIILILGIIITIILLLTEDKKEEEEPKREDWSNYDCYIFSIFWPPSSCYNKESENKECFDRIRELDRDDYFIIHGLWPSYKSGEHTDDCNKNKEINVTFTDEYLFSNLTTYWPGLYSSDQLMWNHEYNKHGYCFIKRIGKNVTKDYDIYFNQGLDLFEKYNVLMELTLPDTPAGLHNITKNKFKQTLKESTYNIDPLTYSLICSRNDTDNTDVLYEIRFNYDLNLEISKNVTSSENCPDKFQIYFSNENKKPVYEKYDFYVLSFLWNPTSCKTRGKDCYKKLKVKKELLNILMIHGLWPSYISGVVPQWCNLDEDIQIQIDNLPEDLYDTMKDYWVGTYYNNTYFWNHEYNKHGLCFNQKYNQSALNYSFYFQKVVDLYFEYNIKDFLKELFPGILPGNRKLNKTYIYDKLKERYGKGSYAMTCFQYENKYWLNEIKLKLDMDFRNDSKGVTSDNCPEEIYAEFLELEGPQEQAAEGFYEEYDMYFFTILWLGTTCKMKGELCYENIEPVRKNTFTLHGLWPNLRNGTLAEWCNGKNDIEIDIYDKDLLEFMNTHYVSGYHTNEYFWGHEYNKHGYCYNQRNNYGVENYEIYFTRIKDMYEHYNFENIFIDIYKDRIEPGDFLINRNEVEEYFKNKGFERDTYLIVCTNITENNGTIVEPHLLEIRIRFDLNFNILPNETDKSEFDCPELFYAQFL